MLLSDTAVGQGEAMLRESLLRIIAEYKPASVEEFAKHPLAKFIRSTVEVRPRVDAAKEEPSATEKPTEEGEADAMSPRPKWLN